MNTTKILILLLLSSIYFVFCSSAPFPKNEAEMEEEGEPEEEKRSKLVAFLLSLFLGGFGVDWFYLSKGFLIYIIAGIIKLFLIGHAGLCCCSFKFDISSCQEGLKKCLGPCRWIISLATFLWWVVDWVRILIDYFPDGSGMELLQDL